MGLLSRTEALAVAVASAALAHVVPWAVARARRALRARAPPAGKVLEQPLNPRFAKAVTAVRGKLTMKANQYRQALDRGEGEALPFDRVVECNIGNPQALGQKPVTFVRQVLSLLDYPQVRVREHVPENVPVSLSLSLSAARSTTPLPPPQLVRDPSLAAKAAGLFPADAIARAKTLLEKIPGGTGAYSESQGALYVRQAVAKFIGERDGIAPGAPESVDPDDVFLTDGASEAVKLALQVCLRTPDDCILLPIPQYPLYSGSINLFGGHLEGYYLEEDGGEWALHPDEVRRAARAARAKGLSPTALVVINPGNPTGNTLSKRNLVDVVRVCAEEKLVLLADEVCRVDDGAATPSGMKLRPKSSLLRCTRRTSTSRRSRSSRSARSRSSSGSRARRSSSSRSTRSRRASSASAAAAAGTSSASASPPRRRWRSTA